MPILATTGSGLSSAQEEGWNGAVIRPAASKPMARNRAAFRLAAAVSGVIETSEGRMRPAYGGMPPWAQGLEGAGGRFAAWNSPHVNAAWV